MKKLALKLDDLQVETFETEKSTGQADVVGYCGTLGKATTAYQDICDCSQFYTDCDFTCPGYWNPDAGCA